MPTSLLGTKEAQTPVILSALGEKEYVLHLIPSGIFLRHITCVIGNGVVIDPTALLSEINQLESVGVNISGRLLVSHNAHLINPYHKLLDNIRQQTSNRIGTTGRGIGPAYIDKFMQTGIKIVDLLDRDVLAKKLEANIEEKNNILTKVYGEATKDVPDRCKNARTCYRRYTRRLRDGKVSSLTLPPTVISHRRHKGTLKGLLISRARRYGLSRWARAAIRQS